VSAHVVNNFVADGSRWQQVGCVVVMLPTKQIVIFNIQR